MTDKEMNGNEGNQSLVVKSKRFGKGDIFAFLLCLLAAFLIWIYASNIQANEEQKREEQINAIVGGTASTEN